MPHKGQKKSSKHQFNRACCCACFLAPSFFFQQNIVIGYLNLLFPGQLWGSDFVVQERLLLPNKPSCSYRCVMHPVHTPSPLIRSPETAMLPPAVPPVPWSPPEPSLWTLHCDLTDEKPRGSRAGLCENRPSPNYPVLRLQSLSSSFPCPPAQPHMLIVKSTRTSRLLQARSDQQDNAVHLADQDTPCPRHKLSDKREHLLPS